MMKSGSFAVAVVHRQVVVVQAVRTHSKREKYLEVIPYTAFGGSRIFLALSEKHVARIPATDLLSILPPSYASHHGDSDTSDSEDEVTSCDAHSNFVHLTAADISVGEGTIELPEHAFEEYVRLSEKHYNRPRSASRSKQLWTSLVGRRH
ncbi:hypothetical protein EST38_g5178 [Candolleomyces aberdarensis]|uniref:Uncharacterized protein n=1 Tax=Candolleomyces aberdarensis TaxID=2316362 RepID=A0A4V1Q430_9AGAR|nr:hypothetical protein EST38_g5178 [Candolleomyces aberdarensis]